LVQKFTQEVQNYNNKLLKQKEKNDPQAHQKVFEKQMNKFVKDSEKERRKSGILSGSDPQMD